MSDIFVPPKFDIVYVPNLHLHCHIVNNLLIKILKKHYKKNT